MSARKAHMFNKRCFSCCRNSTDNKTAMDGGYYSRSDILPWQNSPSSNIQGGILLDDGCWSYSGILWSSRTLCKRFFIFCYKVLAL